MTMMPHERRLIPGASISDALPAGFHGLDAQEVADLTAEAWIANDGVDPEIVECMGGVVMPAVVGRKYIDVDAGGAGKVDASARFVEGDITDSFLPFGLGIMEEQYEGSGSILPFDDTDPGNYARY